MTWKILRAAGLFALMAIFVPFYLIMVELGHFCEIFDNLYGEPEDDTDNDAGV